MQNIIDVDTVGCDGLGSFYDFHINNTFYLLAPPYYNTFYTMYLRRCLQVFDGWDARWHSAQAGLVPERLVQCIARGLNNMLFAHGIDFVTKENDYDFAKKWSKSAKLYNAIKKAQLFAIAGGTSLLKLNRCGKDLYPSAHRIDTFYPEFSSDGNLLSVKIYFDLIQNMNAGSLEPEQYGICEERYYNKLGQSCCKCSVYKVDGNLQNATLSRPQTADSNGISWERLNPTIKRYIINNYPSVVIGKEQLLPFGHSLGCYILRFTETIPQIPNSFFGQPIGDILRTESYQFDQMKYFEKNEVDLARARALLPEEMWNKDDPDYGNRALSERFYQKVSALGSDADKITQIQFQLRGNDIRTQKENIYRDCSAKLNVSASTIASFLSEGAGARTATEITNEKTKTDTWIGAQIRLISPAIDDMMCDVMNYYNHFFSDISIVFKCEDQVPALEKAKTYSDIYTVGNMSPELFVKTVYKNLTEEQQKKEIEFLKEKEKLKTAQVKAYQVQSGATENL